jgi:hypothetical protein
MPLWDGRELIVCSTKIRLETPQAPTQTDLPWQHELAGPSCCAFLVFVGERGHPLRSDLDALLEVVALVENLTRREAGPRPLGRGEPAAPNSGTSQPCSGTERRPDAIGSEEVRGQGAEKLRHHPIFAVSEEESFPIPELLKRLSDAESGGRGSHCGA